MTTRRDFLKKSAATTLPLVAFSPMLTVMGNAVAQTVGNVGVSTWAGMTDVAVWNAVWAKRFTNVLPNLLDTNALGGAGYVYRPDVANGASYTVRAGETSANILGITDASGRPMMTRVWGYGNADLAAVTYPSRSFMATRGHAIRVNWRNALMDSSGNALPHILPVDQTVSMQNDPSGAPITGVPIAIHHHGGDNAYEFDGTPDQWISPARRQIGPGVSYDSAISPVNADANGLSYIYENNEEAALKWYHDHAEGLTRLNAYAGLAGLYVSRDGNEAELVRRNFLPSGRYELALMLQDKVFDPTGQFAYPAEQDPLAPLSPALPGGTAAPTHLPEMFGDVICVNGMAWPSAAVEPRPYRVRLLNASDSRFYTLTFNARTKAANGTDQFGPSSSFRLIGTDLGFMNQAPSLKTLTIGPGERYDLVIDFSGVNGQTLVMKNSAATVGTPVAADSGPDQVMAFKVNQPLNRLIAKTKAIEDATLLRGLVPPTAPLGTQPVTPLLPALAVPAGTTVRKVLLAEGSDEYGRIMPLLGDYAQGTHTFHDPATENVVIPAGQTSVTEVWELWNSTVDAHPLHMHLVKFRMINRQAFTATLTPKPMLNGWTGVTITSPQSPQPALGRKVVSPDLYEAGWKDTVVCPPGFVTRVLVTFNRPGKYVYHCHILSHEEHDMMRWYTVTRA